MLSATWNKNCRDIDYRIAIGIRVREGNININRIKGAKVIGDVKNTFLIDRVVPFFNLLRQYFPIDSRIKVARLLLVESQKVVYICKSRVLSNTFLKLPFAKNPMRANRLQCDVDQYTKVRGRARRKSKSFKSESEEYDTLGSDSDTEVGTSSRTESSNHLDDSGPTSILARSPGPNSVNQREQRLALVQRPVHHSKLVFGFLCPGRVRSPSHSRVRITNCPTRQRHAYASFQMCCTTRTNQVHQPSRHQFLRERLSRGSKNKGKRHRRPKGFSFV